MSEMVVGDGSVEAAMSWMVWIVNETKLASFPLESADLLKT